MPKNPRKSVKGGGNTRRRERRISVRSELRTEPDVKKLARAVVSLVLAQAEADAQAEKATRDSTADADGASR